MDDILAYISSRLLKCQKPYIYYKQVIAEYHVYEHFHYDEYVGPGESCIAIRFFQVPQRLKCEFESKFTWSREYTLSQVYKLALDDPDVKEQAFMIITKEDVV